jgi:hypothetical protein
MAGNTKLKFTKLKAVIDAIKEIADVKNMRKYGELSAGMIKLRTRLGYGVKEEGSDKERLKPLAESTIEARKGNVRFTKGRNGKSIQYPRSKSHGAKTLSEFTTPSRSNLTETGQLLDSVQVTHVERGRVTVGPKGARATDPVEGKQPSNEEVGKFVSKDRPFNNLSRVELKRVNNQIKADLRAAIKSRLTNKK